MKKDFEGCKGFLGHKYRQFFVTKFNGKKELWIKCSKEKGIILKDCNKTFKTEAETKEYISSLYPKKDSMLCKQCQILPKKEGRGFCKKCISAKCYAAYKKRKERGYPLWNRKVKKIKKNNN